MRLNNSMLFIQVISELNTPVSDEYVRDVDELRYILTLPHFRVSIPIHFVLYET